MTDNPRQLTFAGVNGTIDSLDDYEWSFARSSTDYLTHGLQKYPARMPPQIPSTLFDFYLSKGILSEGDTVYDPFSGSGTTSVEAKLHGLNAIANDINPFACLLTKVKSTPLDLNRLEQASSDFFDGLRDEFEYLAQSSQPKSELSPNLREDADQIGTDWFPEPQIYQLLTARGKLDSLEEEYDHSIIQFFRVSLAKAAREVSYQRQGEFKRYRMSEEERISHDIDVFPCLRNIMSDHLSRIRKYSRRVDSELTTEVLEADSRNILRQTNSPVAENCADIVVTSPPYGDHQTTVAYGQFSTNLSIIAEGRTYEEMMSVDKRGLGGSMAGITISDLVGKSESLAETISSLDDAGNRSEDALQFFSDYYQVISEVSNIVKPGQPVAWVVACRRMNGVLVPIHKITQELCRSLGYSTEAILPRSIQNKTLPDQNRQGETMVQEHIVVTNAPNE